MSDKPTRTKSAWLDETAGTPILAEKAKQMETFLSAMADGVIDASEVKTQEARLVKVIKEVEPLLDDRLHEKVTRLLCELTAYDLMQVMHALQQSRPKTVFRG
jgi:hypothetical protein